jgi:hypothetical protein
MRLQFYRADDPLELRARVSTTLPDGRILNNLYYGSGHLHQSPRMAGSPPT